jgi:ABC-type Fe3+/spermidine/putrescine transport system ATPase subunit
VLVALRPERFSLAKAGAPNTIPGQIEEIVFLGAITRLRVQTPAGAITTELHGQTGEHVESGAEVSLAFDGEAATIFPQAGA